MSKPKFRASRHRRLPQGLTRALSTLLVVLSLVGLVGASLTALFDRLGRMEDDARDRMLSLVDAAYDVKVIPVAHVDEDLADPTEHPVRYQVYSAPEGSGFWGAPTMVRTVETGTAALKHCLQDTLCLATNEALRLFGTAPTLFNDPTMEPGLDDVYERENAFRNDPGYAAEVREALLSQVRKIEVATSPYSYWTLAQTPGTDLTMRPTVSVIRIEQPLGDFLKITFDNGRRQYLSFDRGLAPVLPDPPPAPAPRIEQNVSYNPVWDLLAGCESTHRWDINTGNGYFGGIQFSPRTWDAFGGEEFAPDAHQASKVEQIFVAHKVQDAQGWNAWPSCTRKLGITEDPGPPPVLNPQDAPTPVRGDNVQLAAASVTENAPQGSLDEYVAANPDVEITPEMCSEYTPNARNLQAVCVALSKLGAPYRWGHIGPNSFDCSGYLYWVYHEQLNFDMERIRAKAMAGLGEGIDRNDIRHGDILPHNLNRDPSHVGIYIGGNKMVHAPGSGKVVTRDTLSDRHYVAPRRLV